MEDKLNFIMTVILLLSVFIMGVLIMMGGFYSSKYRVLISFGYCNIYIGGFFVVFSLIFIFRIFAPKR